STCRSMSPCESVRGLSQSRQSIKAGFASGMEGSRRSPKLMRCMASRERAERSSQQWTRDGGGVDAVRAAASFRAKSAVALQARGEPGPRVFARFALTGPRASPALCGTNRGITMPQVTCHWNSEASGRLETRRSTSDKLEARPAVTGDGLWQGHGPRWRLALDPGRPISSADAAAVAERTIAAM